jgi:hypothetical protein
MYQSHAGVYGPSKPSRLSSIEASLKCTALLVGLGEKLGTDPWIGLPACNELGALFLESSGIHPDLSMTRERLPRTGTAHRKRTPNVRGLAWEAYVSC